MNKIYNYLGLAEKARLVASGEQAVESGCRRGKVHLLIISTDASKNTEKKFKSLAQNHNLKWIKYGEMNELGFALGKSPRSVVGILDQNFANAILKTFQELVQ